MYPPETLEVLRYVRILKLSSEKTRCDTGERRTRQLLTRLLGKEPSMGNRRNLQQTGKVAERNVFFMDLDINLSLQDK